MPDTGTAFGWRLPLGSDIFKVGFQAVRDLATDIAATIGTLTDDTGWIDCTINSGFAHQNPTNTPHEKLQVRRIGALCKLRGGVSNAGITTANTTYTVANLPAGFPIPYQTEVFAAGTSVGAATASCFVVQVTGAIQVRTGGTLSSYYKMTASWFRD